MGTLWPFLVTSYESNYFKLKSHFKNADSHGFYLATWMTRDDLCKISRTQEIFYLCWLFRKGSGVLEALFWEHRRS